jgi:very-short-patch-repair endonuclease
MLASLIFENWYPFLTIPAAILHPGEKIMTKGDLIIAPQFNFGPYRLDLLIFGHDDAGNQKLVNVECDGDKHHNTTMAKYQDDRERDKFLRACRIEVIRFSGSQIWNNASDCAEEVLLSLKRWRWMNWSNAVVNAA